jgi:hypothetical protein
LPAAAFRLAAVQVEFLGLVPPPLRVLLSRKRWFLFARNVCSRLTRTEVPMFLLQKCFARPGLFRSGVVQLAPPRTACVHTERSRITINDVRLASLGIALDAIGNNTPSSASNRGVRP